MSLEMCHFINTFDFKKLLENELRFVTDVVLRPLQTPYLSCAVPNTFSLLGRIKRQALPFPEILACLIEICRKKLIWTPYNCQKTTYYLVRHMRGTASELGLRIFCHAGSETRIAFKYKPTGFRINFFKNDFSVYYFVFVYS